MTINSNRLTIIVNDGTVITDDEQLSDLNLSNCGIPTDVHAFQWLNNSGEIEYNGVKHNQYVTILPDWASNCYDVLNLSVNKR
jgi:hypothetical protein